MPNTFIHQDPATGLPVGTVAAFLTLGSALVALFQGGAGPRTYMWTCLGCGESDTYAANRHTMRDHANAHAVECRAIPLPRTSA